MDIFELILKDWVPRFDSTDSILEFVHESKELSKEEQIKKYDAERSRICEMLKQIPFDHFKSTKYVLQLSAVNRNLLASILNKRIDEIDSEMKRLRQEE